MVKSLFIFLVWMLRSVWVYIALDHICNLRKNRWKLVVQILAEGCCSAFLWTIPQFPFWISLIFQITIDQLFIVDYFWEYENKSRFMNCLIWSIVLESCWFSGWMLASPLAESFSAEKASIEPVIQMVLSILIGSGLFSMISFGKFTSFNKESFILLLYISLMTVYSAEVLSIHPSLENWFLCLLTGISSCLTGSLLHRIVLKRDLEHQEWVLERSSSSLLQKQQNVEDADQDLREFRHSFKNHLLILQALNKHGDTEEIDRYLCRLTKQNSPVHFSVFCDDPVINAIFSQVQNSYPEIHFDLMADPRLESLPWQTHEILFLALDNACEELQRNPDLPKVVSASITIKKDQVICSVINPLSSIKTLKTEKDCVGHGLGLQRMKRLASEAGLELLIKQSNNFLLLCSVPISRCSVLGDQPNLTRVFEKKSKQTLV